MPTKTKKAKTNGSTKQNGKFRVRIRMYRHGLGDCFLLRFPKKRGKHVHVMIDCGIVLGTSEPDVVMKQVAEDLKKETGGTVDVLVITHEHWDHLSGFDENQARAIFKDFDFKELWLAWTEEEGNALADQLRAEREKRKAAARKAKEEAEKRGLTERAARMAGLLGLFGAAEGESTGDSDEKEAGGGTAGALAFLKKKCEPTILQTSGKPQSIPGVNGVHVYVLGPPMDGDAMKKTNPYKGEGYGIGGTTIGLADAFMAAFDPDDERGQPFGPAMRQPYSGLKELLVGQPPEGLLGWYARPEHEWRNIDDAWLGMGERLALQLDNATNNTSLVLAFEFEGSNDVLLFVGDAQAGNWRSWDSCKWVVKDKDGQRRKVTAADLLERTIFYKVGHHGSHNATLREKGLERMTSRHLAAVIPVDTNVAHDVKGWKHMPLPAIRTRLEEKCAVIFQSDQDPLEKRKVPQARWEDSKQKFEVRMKNKETGNVETVRTQPLYTDYFI